MKRAAAIKLGDVVEVEWVDITSHDGWMGFDEAQHTSVLQCKSYGRVVSIDEQLIRVAGTFGVLKSDPAGNPDWAAVWTIPLAVVSSIRKLV